MISRKAISCALAAISGFASFGAGASHAAPPAKPAPKVVNAGDKTVTGTVPINAVTRTDAASKVMLQLAQDGEALLPVVISAKASDATKAVAKELATYLGRISGATFRVETGDGTSGIVLGSMKDFPTPALAKALEIRKGFDGKEAFAIRTREKKVLLLGATDLGVSHAANRFLHELGYRHFFPHKAWEVVPDVPDLKFGREITDRPQMLSRVIWFEAGSGTADAEKNYQDWKRHNLAAESFKVSAGHALSGVIDANKAEFDKHPEYYPLIKQADGTMKRQPAGGQMELGNPAVRKMVVDSAINHFKQWPNEDMVSLEPADSNSYSQSPESLALGTVSDQVFGIANEAARALQKAYPGQNKMVGLLSYNSTYDPPSFKLEPNVHVQLASIGVNPKYSNEERWKLWPQRAENLGVYEYYSVWAWSTDQLPGSYTNDVRASQKHIRDELVARNVVSMSAESTSSWGSNGRGYYVAQKLMWNPNLDLEALLDDFYTKAFGPAAKAMEKYYERISPASNPLMSSSLLGQLFRDIDEASKAAADRPDVIARIDQLKVYLRYVDMRWRRDGEGLAVDGEEIMMPLYRGREYAMTSWSMISQSWGGGRSNEAPYTHAEIEKGFQEGLLHYRPKIRDDLQPRQTFSTDLVAVQWPNIKPEQNKVDSTQTYQGSMKYAMWSMKGEPLQFTTKTGSAWGYKTSYEVTDAKGKVIASGKPDFEQTIEHKIAVPAPGLYYLQYSDPGAYWTFTAKAGLPYSIVALPEVATARGVSTLPEVYFYVPKGTKRIEYFATSPHNVYGPDGSEQKLIPIANDWITIPVPQGMDGKPWTMRNVTFGKFTFSNVPSYFSPTPDGLMVPRSLAVKDGLTIRK